MSDEEESEVTIDARRFAGVWANAVEVEAWADEVTMDFIRMDPVESRGMVVARVTCSPAFLRTLVDKLEGVWQNWAWRSSSPETEGPE
jgi:hypothetical protein